MFYPGIIQAGPSPPWHLMHYCDVIVYELPDKQQQINIKAKDKRVAKNKYISTSLKTTYDSQFHIFLIYFLLEKKYEIY